MLSVFCVDFMLLFFYLNTVHIKIESSVVVSEFLKETFALVAALTEALRTMNVIKLRS